jgi:hypothetical protein
VSQRVCRGQAGDRGASFAEAVSVSPGVWMYQMTETGLAAEIADLNNIKEI